MSQGGSGSSSNFGSPYTSNGPLGGFGSGYGRGGMMGNYGGAQAGGNMYQPGGNVNYAKAADSTFTPPQSSYQPPQFAPEQAYLQAQYQPPPQPSMRGYGPNMFGQAQLNRGDPNMQTRMMFSRGQMDPNYMRPPPTGGNPPPTGGSPPPIVTPPPVTPTPVTPTPTPDPTPTPTYTPPYTPGPNESPPVGGAWGQSGGLLSAQSAMFMGGANGPTSPPPNNDYSMGWNYAKKAWEPMK